MLEEDPAKRPGPYLYTRFLDSHPKFIYILRTFAGGY